MTTLAQLEHRKKFIAKFASQGHSVSVSARRKIAEANHVRVVSSVTCQKISEHHKRTGFKPPSNLGNKASLETRKKMSERFKGEKSHFWRGGVSKVNKLIRKSLEYKVWREAVFKRDNYTCTGCHTRGGELHADHIKQFAYFPELRLELSNGRTLCRKCHEKTPTWKNKI